MKFLLSVLLAVVSVSELKASKIEELLDSGVTSVRVDKGEIFLTVNRRFLYYLNGNEGEFTKPGQVFVLKEDFQSINFPDKHFSWSIKKQANGQYLYTQVNDLMSFREDSFTDCIVFEAKDSELVTISEKTKIEKYPLSESDVESDWIWTLASILGVMLLVFAIYKRKKMRNTKA